HIAFAELVHDAALDVPAPPLALAGLLSTCHRAPGDEGRFAVGHVENVRFFVMHLYLSGFVAMIAGNGVSSSLCKRSARDQRLGDLIAADVGSHFSSHK